MALLKVGVVQPGYFFTKGLCNFFGIDDTKSTSSAIKSFQNFTGLKVSSAYADTQFKEANQNLTLTHEGYTWRKPKDRDLVGPVPIYNQTLENNEPTRIIISAHSH